MMDITMVRNMLLSNIQTCAKVKDKDFFSYRVVTNNL